MNKNIIAKSSSIISILLLASFSFFLINQKYNAEVYEKEIDKEQETETIKIDIKGNIKNPGVYELNENSRVIDAIEKAGGLETNASTRYINLSKKLKDENIIIINSIEEIKELKEKTNNSLFCENYNNACINEKEIVNNEIKTENNTSSNNELNTLVNINEAPLEVLTTLTGIGESKAIKIIEYRNNNGKFKNIEELKQVSGIGESIYEKIKNNITV